MTEPKRPYVIQDSTNRVTIAIQIEPDGLVRVAVALCNPKDHFARKVGFQKAHWMLTSPKSVLGRYTGTDWKADILPRIKAVLSGRANRLKDLQAHPTYRKSLVVIESWTGRRELRQDILEAVTYSNNFHRVVPVAAGISVENS